MAKSQTGWLWAVGAAAVGVLAYFGLRKGGFDGVEGVRGLGGGRRTANIGIQPVTEAVVRKIQAQLASGFLAREVNGVAAHCFPPGSDPHFLGLVWLPTVLAAPDSDGNRGRYPFQLRIKYNSAANVDLLAVQHCMIDTLH